MSLKAWKLRWKLWKLYELTRCSRPWSAIGLWPSTTAY